jgi:hypothetical protein
MKVFRMQTNEHCIINYWSNAQLALGSAREGVYHGDAMARIAVVMKAGPPSLRDKAKRVLELVAAELGYYDEM